MNGSAADRGGMTVRWIAVEERGAFSVAVASACCMAVGGRRGVQEAVSMHPRKWTGTFEGSWEFSRIAAVFLAKSVTMRCRQAILRAVTCRAGKQIQGGRSREQAESGPYPIPWIKL